jgi:CRISPR-associated protein Csx16
MTIYLVARHAAAMRWLKAQLPGGVPIAHLDMTRIDRGDVVAGTVPAHLAACLTEKGARYLHLALDLAPAQRGLELADDDLLKSGARLIELRVEPVDRPAESTE